MESNKNNYSEDILLLESIRAGIPTRMTADKLPDLRHNLTCQIDSDLDDLVEGKIPKGRFIWGEYGQGKTHCLKMIEQHCLKRGFAVSYYTLNRDLGLNNLKSLFPALSEHTLTGKNKVPGILNQLVQETIPTTVIEALPDIEKKLSHPLPSLFLQAFLSFLDPDEMLTLYNALMGNSVFWTPGKSICRKAMRNEMKKMPKFTVREFSHAFFEFYPLLLRAMGYKGWVILLDEIELIGKLGKVGRLKSYINLSYLLNWNKEHSLPIYTLAASAKTLQTDVFYSRKNDVVKIPIAAEEKYDSQTAYKLTRFFELSSKSSRNINLTPINRKDYYQLLRVIFHTHQKSIKWVEPADESLIGKLEKIVRPEQKPIRISVRMFIELLDVYASSGRLLSCLKEEKFSEHTLNEPDDFDENGGFLEKPLDEMFDEV